MKALVLLLALASVPPDLAQLERQIVQFPTTRGTGTDSQRLAKFFDLIWAARMREQPDLATFIGYAGLEDRMPDFSPEMLALAHRLAHEELTAIGSIDRAKLDATEKTSYDLARREFETEIEGERFHELDPFHDDYLLVNQMDNRIASALGLIGYLPAKDAADYEKMLARLRAFPTVVDEGIARLDEGLKLGITPPRVTLRRVPEQVTAGEPLKNALLEPFRKMPATMPAADRERLLRDATAIVEQQVEPAMRKLHDYLANTYVPHARESTSVSDLPDGKARYAYLLRYFTTTDLTPDQIHEIGLAEVKRIRAEMDAVIASTGFKGTFRQFCDLLRTDPRFFFDKPEDLVAAHREIAKRIDPELIRLFGHLPRLPYGIKTMTEEETGGVKSAPSALYNGGSLAGRRPGWMLINTYDLKARPKWGMESLTLHESVPGHHLQYSLVEELGSLPDWRRYDIYPVFSEGWALYAESLGDELGLYKDPYSKFGALNNDIWRAMRLVIDTGLQTKGWTRQQAIDYCRANSAKTDVEIENEIDRYIAQPGSVSCYKIGELKIRELRRYAEKELGANFDVRAFHDRILDGGPLPLDLLEQSVKEWVQSERSGATR